VTAIADIFVAWMGPHLGDQQLQRLAAGDVEHLSAEQIEHANWCRDCASRLEIFTLKTEPDWGDADASEALDPGLLDVAWRRAAELAARRARTICSEQPSPAVESTLAMLQRDGAKVDSTLRTMKMTPCQASMRPLRFHFSGSSDVVESLRQALGERVKFAIPSIQPAASCTVRSSAKAGLARNIRELPWPDAILHAQALSTNDSYRVGQLLMERVYESQLDAKPSNLRKLQSSALPGVSVSTLQRCIQVYETCRALELSPPWTHVRSGHFFAVAALPRTQQRRLLERVEKEGWTVVRLQKELEEQRGNALSDGRLKRRRRLPGFIKALQAISKESLLDGLKQAEELDPTRLRRLARQIASAQAELGLMRTETSKGEDPQRQRPRGVNGELAGAGQKKNWTVTMSKQNFDEKGRSAARDGRRPSEPDLIKALQDLSKQCLRNRPKQAEELDPTWLRKLDRQLAHTQEELTHTQAELARMQTESMKGQGTPARTRVRDRSSGPRPDRPN
jgi:hypothetical protein